MLLLLLVPPMASAASAIDKTASCLSTQPVCGSLSAAERDSLAREIDQRGAAPMYVAVLPSGDAQTAERQLERRVGREGTYAVVAGHSFYAHSTDIPIGRSARAALATHGNQGGVAILTDFIDRVGSQKAASAAPSGGGSSDGGSSSSGALPLILLGALGLGGGALFLNARRQRQRREQRELEEVKRVARDDLVALGDDIRALDLDVEMPGAVPAAKADYERALGSYDQANTRFERAQRPGEIAPVTQALEEGRFAMTSAKARLNGEQPPERRPPCFFDPRHGPSSRDVEWAPAGGVPRPVPACEADAQRVESGLDPHVCEIDVGGRQVAYWNAPAYYGPWSGGFFGGFGGFGGGFLGGLLAGGAARGGRGGHSRGEKLHRRGGR